MGKKSKYKHYYRGLHQDIDFDALPTEVKEHAIWQFRTHKSSFPNPEPLNALLDWYRHYHQMGYGYTSKKPVKTGMWHRTWHFLSQQPESFFKNYISRRQLTLFHTNPLQGL